MDKSPVAVSAFHAAVEQLRTFAPTRQMPLTQNFGVATAVLLHRTDPARYVVSGPAGAVTTTSDLQLEVCDKTWEKDPAFLPATASGPIYKPFTDSFKGGSASVNNWRNSFDIQGGIGCNAPYEPAFLQSSDYISEHRFNCGLRERSTGLCLAAGSGALCYNPTKKGDGFAAGHATTARHRPKILKRGTDSAGVRGYWSIDPTLESLTDLLGDPFVRVPAKPFAVALLAGSPYWSQWGEEASVARLQALLALDDEMFLSIFDTTSTIETSGSSAPGTSGTTSTVNVPKSAAPLQPKIKPAPTQATIKAVDYVDRDTGIVIEWAGGESDPERRRQLLESATQGHRRVLNVLAGALRSAGFSVDEQPGGYDLHAFDGAERHILFEAKTWTRRNLASQVRSGWAQLEE